jgi:starch phosphorylase
MQQHCIGINGTFFNTHRMLGQYLRNAYFPQISPEEAVPIEADLQAAAAKSPAASRRKKPSPGEDEADPTLEEPPLA